MSSKIVIKNCQLFWTLKIYQHICLKFNFEFTCTDFIKILSQIDLTCLKVSFPEMLSKRCQKGAVRNAAKRCCQKRRKKGATIKAAKKVPLEKLPKRCHQVQELSCFCPNALIKARSWISRSIELHLAGIVAADEKRLLLKPIEFSVACQVALQAA